MLFRSKGESRTAEAAEDVEVRSFCGERKRQRGQRRFAVEAGAAEACASEKMSDGFQVV